MFEDIRLEDIAQLAKACGNASNLNKKRFVFKENVYTVTRCESYLKETFESLDLKSEDSGASISKKMMQISELRQFALEVAQIDIITHEELCQMVSSELQEVVTALFLEESDTQIRTQVELEEVISEDVDFDFDGVMVRITRNNFDNLDEDMKNDTVNEETVSVDGVHMPVLFVVEVRQMKNKKTETMVQKDGKVKVIDKKDEKKFLDMGYTLAECMELQIEAVTPEKIMKDIAALEKMISKIGGNSSAVKMKKVALERKIAKLEKELEGMEENVTVVAFLDMLNEYGYGKKKMKKEAMGKDMPAGEHMFDKEVDGKTVMVHKLEKTGKFCAYVDGDKIGEYDDLASAKKAAMDSLDETYGKKKMKNEGGYGKINATYGKKAKEEELSPKQKKIDKNKNGKIDGSDLQSLRKESVNPYESLYGKPLNEAMTSKEKAKARALAKADKDAQPKDKVSLKKAPWDKKESVEVDEASEEGKVRIIKTKDNKFQVQRMTKGEFVDQGKPYAKKAQAEKERSTGQSSMQFESILADMSEILSFRLDEKGPKIDMKKYQDHKDRNKKKKTMSSTKKNLSDISKRAEKMANESVMSPKQIDALKKSYESLRGKKIDAKNGMKISRTLEKLDQDSLVDLMNSDIPFVSTLAVNKLMMNHGMSAAEINKSRNESVEESSEKGPHVSYLDNGHAAIKKQLELGSKGKFKKAQQRIDDHKSGKKPDKNIASMIKDLGESVGDMEAAAAELEAYAKKSGGMDKNTFMRVATLLKTGHPDKLKSYINSMDTDPREYVAMLLKKHVGNKSAEKMLDIKFRGESISWEDAETLRAAGVTEEISGSGYELYHKTLGSAIDTAITQAKLQYGIDITPDERMEVVGMGPRKPSNGKTNTYRLMGNKGKAIQVQVYNRGGSRPYELNMYKE